MQSQVADVIEDARPAVAPGPDHEADMEACSGGGEMFAGATASTRPLGFRLGAPRGLAGLRATQRPTRLVRNVGACGQTVNHPRA